MATPPIARVSPTVQLLLRVPPEVKEALVAAATADPNYYMSMNDIAIAALRKHLGMDK
jgi:predicted HicB family RNase H-like nuclease